MKEYLLSIIAAALFAAMLGILTPFGKGTALSAHMRLILAIFLLCILLSPLKNAVTGAVDWFSGGFEEQLPQETDKEEYQKELEDAINSSSRTYLTSLLIDRLESEFAIKSGEVRCAIRWEGDTGARPRRVSVILSGDAVWKDPSKIEKYVEQLLGCECVSAIE